MSWTKEERAQYMKEYRQKNKAKILAYKQQWRKDNDLWHKYKSQENMAATRGIEWQFDFETWVDWWGKDISKRGRSADSLVMARIGDQGPYHPENVEKLTFKENATFGK